KAIAFQQGVKICNAFGLKFSFVQGAICFGDTFLPAQVPHVGSEFLQGIHNTDIDSILQELALPQGQIERLVRNVPVLVPVQIVLKFYIVDNLIDFVKMLGILVDQKQLVGKIVGGVPIFINLNIGYLAFDQLTDGGIIVLVETFDIGIPHQGQFKLIGSGPKFPKGIVSRFIYMVLGLVLGPVAIYGIARLSRNPFIDVVVHIALGEVIVQMEDPNQYLQGHKDQERID